MCGWRLQVHVPVVAAPQVLMKLSLHTADHKPIRGLALLCDDISVGLYSSRDDKKSSCDSMKQPQVLETGARRSSHKWAKLQFATENSKRSEASPYLKNNRTRSQ